MNSSPAKPPPLSSLALKSINNLRCIRLSGLLGALQIGSHSSTANVATPCTAYARF
jgi:hypothetical protein